MGGEIEEFKKMLTHFVRDAAIKDCDIILRADKNNELARIIIADCVDQTIFFLLQSIDEEALKISFEALNGEQLKLY